MKKRFLALVLVVAMVMGMSMTTFAEGENVEEPTVSGFDGTLNNDIVIPKKYVIENGTAPAETFTYNFEGVSYKNGDGVVTEAKDGAEIPTISDKTISFEAISETTDGKATFKINPNDYKLGVYTYKVTEVKKNTTGVTYSDEELYLVLTILRDEENGQHYVGAMHYENANGTDKSTGFTNYYDAGSLEVSKTITGNSADMTKEFKFNITFTFPENTESHSAIKVTNGTTVNTVIDSDGFTQSVSLGHGESIKFENLPEGTKYVISEGAENYEQKSVKYNGVEQVTDASDNNITISGDITGTEENGTKEKDTAAYENNLTNEVDTGIFTTNMPYILALVAIAAVAVVMFRRKREF